MTDIEETRSNTVEIQTKDRTIKTKEKVISKFVKADDLELHLRHVTVTVGKQKHEYYDLRDFVPSTKTYAKGVFIPAERADEIFGSIKEAIFS